jgi:tRNA CCA-adding enzyme
MQNILEKIKPKEAELEALHKKTSFLISKLESSIKSKKIKAQVFLGGSLAKNTIIKKDNYDIDIFVRFDEKYEDKEISRLLEKIIQGTGEEFTKIHGSRDYFHIKHSNILFEIIPTVKIAKPEHARNITDLSYFHVSYVLNEIKKNKKLSDEIMLAKSFAYFQNCYGAESYIKGFSGYALELLVIHYKSFKNFIKAMSKPSKLPIIIDKSGAYKSSQDILDSVNEAKLQSPIIFIDPTYKERNALAALSLETFKKFQQASIRFSKKPSQSFFKEKKINPGNFNLILQVNTSKQEGDIAGSKLLKFSRFIAHELGKYYKISSTQFQYFGAKHAMLYYKIKSKPKIIMQGPPINKPDRVSSFKQAHKKVFIKNNIAYAEEKTPPVKEFFSKFMKKNSQVFKDMDITLVKIVKMK